MIIIGSTNASPSIFCRRQSLHLVSLDLSLDSKSNAPATVWVSTGFRRSWELSGPSELFICLPFAMGRVLGNKRAVYVSTRLDTGTRTYNVHSGLPSPKPYVTPCLEPYGLEMCGGSDLCMHCNVDEITGRIANSNHATKTRWDIGSAPVIPMALVMGPRSPNTQDLPGPTGFSQLSMGDDCKCSY
jgi:hypothetical protein